jgi:hypothetical protein
MGLEEKIKETQDKYDELYADMVKHKKEAEGESSSKIQPIEMAENPSDSIDATKNETKPLTNAEVSLHKMDPTKLDENMAYAYITFKSQDDYALAMRSFNNLSRNWFNCVRCCSCCCPKQRERHD